MKHLRNNEYIPRKRLYTVAEAAQFLGRPVYSLRMLIYSKALPVVKDTAESIKIYLDIADLEAFIESRKGTL